MEVESSVDFSVQYHNPTLFSQKKKSPSLYHNIPTITHDRDQEHIKITQERGQISQRIAIGLSTKSPVESLAQTNPATMCQTDESRWYRYEEQNQQGKYA